MRQFKTSNQKILLIKQMSLFHHQLLSGTADAVLSFPGAVVLAFVFSVLGLVWAFVNYLAIRATNLDYPPLSPLGISDVQHRSLLDIGRKINEGAREFLRQEYLVCLIFVVFMFFVIFGFIERFQTAYTSFAFLVGALTSMLCGIIGMMIATFTNYRVTYLARQGLAPAFRASYRGGCVMGFALVSIGLLTLILMIVFFKNLMGLSDYSGSSTRYYLRLFEAIAGYGLGGSTVALFGRVGGGIYTKAADVGADLVGKVIHGLDEDSPRNPATIADNVGDNVGDIAGMGADLFGSLAESTCAALVISSNTLFSTGSQVVAIQNLMYPISMIAFGVVVSILTSIIGIYCNKVDEPEKIETALKYQVIISTVLLVVVLYAVATISYPSSFIMTDVSRTKIMYPWKPYVCAVFGLVSGMIIGGFTEYMTSHSYKPVRELAESCRTGAATNIIYGLALGYLSTIVPVLLIALTALVSSYILGYYGVALAALGMLSNLPIALALDGYGPIADNAGGIAEMTHLGSEVRERTDALDAAGNTTAAIGKGFAIGSAALVALSLYGGFLHNSGLVGTKNPLTLTDPMIFAMLLVGAMLPYAFSAFTMKSVGKAALKMVNEIKHQFSREPGILEGTVEPDYNACIAISTRASLVEMVAPGLLVILTPIAIGVVLGPRGLAGFLPGAIVSGVQLAISAANTGGAWDNAKKYIEGRNVYDETGEHVVHKGSDIHKAAVIGDTVGDPLKDTSGPALNILVKLMAILSLVFASFFARLHRPCFLVTCLIME